jgi:hypothetical protein
MIAMIIRDGIEAARMKKLSLSRFHAPVKAAFACASHISVQHLAKENRESCHPTSSKLTG